MFIEKGLESAVERLCGFGERGKVQEVRGDVVANQRFEQLMELDREDVLLILRILHEPEQADLSPALRRVEEPSHGNDAALDLQGAEVQAPSEKVGVVGRLDHVRERLRFGNVFEPGVNGRIDDSVGLFRGEARVKAESGEVLDQQGCTGAPGAGDQNVPVI